MSKRAMPSINSCRQPAAINENPSKSTEDASRRDSRRRSRNDCVLSGRYRLQRTVGTGNFAKVKLAVHIATGKEVAIKVIDKSELTASGRRKLTREVQLMKELNHPNIVKLLEIIETERFTYLVLEYLKGGEVYEWLVKNGKMTESMAREKFRQILSAVEYCHQKGIIHRDLKTENLLLDEHMNVKLVDFGFANKFNLGSKLNTFCGSAPYAAPELFKGKEYNGPEVDVWSLGVILYKLVSGVLPFDGQSLSELRHQVVRGHYRVPFYMTTECESLLKKMLRVEPNKRNSIKMIMNDRWVNQGYENDLLQPYVEPKKSPRDSERFQALIRMGYSLEAIINSFREKHFDEIHAAYMLTESNPAILVGEPTNGRPPSPVNTLSESKKASENKNSVLLKQHRVSFQSEVNTPRVNGDAYKTTATPLVNGYDETMRPGNAELVNGGPNKPRIILITSSNKNGNYHDSGPGRSSAIAYEPKLNNDYADEERDTIAYLPDHTSNHLNTYDVRPMIRPFEEEPEIVKPLPRQHVPIRSKTFAIKKSEDNKANYYGGHEITIETEQTFPGPDEDTWKNNFKDASQLVRFKPFRQTVHGTRCIDHAKGNLVERKTPDKLSVVGRARVNLFEVDENESLTVVSGEETDGVNKSRTLLGTVTSKSIRSKPTDDRFKPLNTDFQPDKHIQTQMARDYSYLVKTDNPPLVTQSTWQNTDSEEVSGGKGSRDLLSANGKDSPVNKEPMASGGTAKANNPGSPRGLSFIRTWTTRIKKRSGSKSSEDSNSMVAPNSSRSSECNDDREHSICVPLTDASGTDVSTTSRLADDKTADGRPWPKAKGSSQTKLFRAATTIQTNVRKQIPTPASKLSDSPEGENNADVPQNQTKPRNLTFSLFVKNTSRKPLDQIQPEIRRTLLATGCSFEQSTQFLFTCEHRTYDQKDFVKFELEICTLSLKNCFAIHYKKVSGDYLHYRNLIAKIAKEMNI